MIGGGVTPESAAAVDAHLEATRLRIFAGVREGMQEGMEGLAWTIADKLQGRPLISRSGKLLGAILGGIKVRESQRAITGSITPDTHDGRYLAQWLEEGYHVPAVSGKLIHFFTKGGVEVFSRGHKAFDVAPKPFMNPSLEEYAPTLLDIISAKVAEAVNVD